MTSLASTTEYAPDTTKRSQVAKEMLESERSYLQGLHKLRNLYISPLMRSVLSREKAKILFGNIDEIIGLSETFLKELDDRFSAWSNVSTIGDIFLKYAMFFKMYVMYTNGYQDGINEIAEIIQENAQAHEINKVAQSAGVSTISSLMITPIQRLPRYVLLLKVCAVGASFLC